MKVPSSSPPSLLSELSLLLLISASTSASIFSSSSSETESLLSRDRCRLNSLKRWSMAGSCFPVSNLPSGRKASSPSSESLSESSSAVFSTALGVESWTSNCPCASLDRESLSASKSSEATFIAFLGGFKPSHSDFVPVSAHCCFASFFSLSNSRGKSFSSTNLHCSAQDQSHLGWTTLIPGSLFASRSLLVPGLPAMTWVVARNALLGSELCRPGTSLSWIIAPNALAVFHSRFLCGGIFVGITPVKRILVPLRTEWRISGISAFKSGVGIFPTSSISRPLAISSNCL